MSIKLLEQIQNLEEKSFHAQLILFINYNLLVYKVNEHKLIPDTTSQKK